MRSMILVFIALAVPILAQDTGEEEPTKPEKPVNPELAMDPIQLIKSRGYPAETHKVTTQDRYVLDMYRIPKGRSDTSKTETRPVVLLLHGFETSAADWLINSADKSAAYIFADAGFDVWMGNFRGSRYSQTHEIWDRSTQIFWQFSLDELIQHDLPTMITKVLETTKSSSIYLVAHSTATTAAFVALSKNEVLAKKVRQVHAMAPLLNMQNVQGPLKFARHIISDMHAASALFGTGELRPNKELERVWARYVCHDPEKDVTCQNALLMIAGPQSNQLDESQIEVINARSPAGTSVRTLVHLGQLMNAQRLQSYDMGSPIQNTQRYGQPQPLVYDVTKMLTPTFIFSSECDWIAEPLDVNMIANTFRQALISHTIVPSFNHMDFLWGTRAATEVYNPIVTAIVQDFQLLPRPSPQ